MTGRGLVNTHWLETTNLEKLREKGFSQTTTSDSILSGSETVKLHFCFSSIPAVWYYWWSLVPRNKVKGVITLSDGYELSSGNMWNRFCQAWNFSPESRLCFALWISFPSLSIYLSVSLSVCQLFFHAPCVHSCITCALLSMAFALEVFFYEDTLSTSRLFKTLPEGNTWPLFSPHEHIGALIFTKKVFSLWKAQPKSIHVQVLKCRRCCSAGTQIIDPSLSPAVPVYSGQVDIQMFTAYMNKSVRHFVWLSVEFEAFWKAVFSGFSLFNKSHKRVNPKPQLAACNWPVIINLMTGGKSCQSDVKPPFTGVDKLNLICFKKIEHYTKKNEHWL